ncbi:MAG: InlB B-repeat-containing protein [Clostridia bacterium]|nr:InlB B-repeat-containing protein [Clostridia bacterium]
MANVSKKSKNSKKAGLTKKSRTLLLSIMSVVIVISIGMAVVFGFKLHLYGKEFTVTLNANGGQVTPVTKVIEFGKEYSLPKATKDGDVFAYWRVGGDYTKVELKGRWTIDKDVTLVAVWQSEVKDNGGGEDWTDNY